MYKIGIGYDAHKFGEGSSICIGGTLIPFHRGLIAHSDGDVLTHALMDAILGALGEGDIGRLFPDTDDRYRGVYSLKLLEKVYSLMDSKGYEISNVDMIFIGQRPKIMKYSQSIIENYCRILNTKETSINLKGTTTEGMGFTGREEGLASKVVVLIRRK